MFYLPSLALSPLVSERLDHPHEVDVARVTVGDVSRLLRDPVLPVMRCDAMRCDRCQLSQAQNTPEQRRFDSTAGCIRLDSVRRSSVLQFGGKPRESGRFFVAVVSYSITIQGDWRAPVQALIRCCGLILVPFARTASLPVYKFKVPG